MSTGGGGGVSPAGENGIPLFVFPPNLSVSQTVKIPTPTSPLVWRVGALAPVFQSSSGVDSPVIIPERYSLS